MCAWISSIDELTFIKKKFDTNTIFFSDIHLAFLFLFEIFWWKVSAIISMFHKGFYCACRKVFHHKILTSIGIKCNKCKWFWDGGIERCSCCHWNIGLQIQTLNPCFTSLDMFERLIRITRNLLSRQISNNN